MATYNDAITVIYHYLKESEEPNLLSRETVNTLQKQAREIARLEEIRFHLVQAEKISDDADKTQCRQHLQTTQIKAQQIPQYSAKVQKQITNIAGKTKIQIKEEDLVSAIIAIIVPRLYQTESNVSIISFFCNMACKVGAYNKITVTQSSADISLLKDMIRAIASTFEGRAELFAIQAAEKMEAPTFANKIVNRYFSTPNDIETIARLLNIAIKNKDSTIQKILNAFHQKPHLATPYQVKLVSNYC